MADTITLVWSGGSSTLPVLIEKGLERPEKYSMYPPIHNQYTDGSSDQQYKAYIRSCNIKTNALTGQQLKDYLSYNLDNNHTLNYSIQGISETGLYFPSDPNQETVWLNDLKLSPGLEININEGICRTGSWPV